MPKSVTQYGFHFDAARCSGCRTCVVACQDYKNLNEKMRFRTVHEHCAGDWRAAKGGTWTASVSAHYVSMACGHCDTPLCKAVCVPGAIWKDTATGAVQVKRSSCSGCGECADACPYDAIFMHKTSNCAIKCDLCVDLVNKGQAPVCVEACPMRALDFGLIDDLRRRYGELADLAPLPDSSRTCPNIVITPPR